MDKMDLLKIYKERIKGIGAEDRTIIQILFDLLKEGNLTEEELDNYMLEHLEDWEPEPLPTTPACYSDHLTKYKEAVEKAKQREKQVPQKRLFFCGKCLYYMESYFDVLQDNYVKMRELEELKIRLLKRNPADPMIGKIDTILYEHEYVESREYEKIRAGRRKL
jgi:hypothetical protein